MFATQRSTDYCAVRAVSPEYTVLGAQNPTNPWCGTSTGWVTRYTGLGTDTLPKVDIYNILNANPILTYNQAFNPVVNTTSPSANWLAPQSTLQPRFFKFSAQIDF